MKKLLLLTSIAFLTISLSAASHRTRTAEDIQVHETLEYLKAQGDIIMPTIHVYANAPQDTIRTAVQKRDQRREKNQTGDQIQSRNQSGDPIMTRAEKREMRREQVQLKDGSGDQIQSRDRDQINKQVKPMNRKGARAPMSRPMPPRTSTIQRGNRK